VWRNHHSWSAGAAEAAGLGAFRHKYRRLNEVSGRAVGFLSWLVSLAVFFLAPHDAWLAILIIVVLAVLALLGYVYLPYSAISIPGPLTNPSRIDVYAQGLVLADGLGGARAVRWEQVTAVKRVAASRWSVEYAYRVSHDVPGADPAQFTVSNFTSQSALIRSIGRRTAVPVSYWRQAVGVGLAAAAIAVYVWQLVLPQGEPSVVGQLPSDNHSLSAACVGAGTAYSSAAAYAGSGPHPVIAFSSDPDVSFSTQWTSDNTATIQLVACVNRDGNVTISGMALCASGQANATIISVLGGSTPAIVLGGSTPAIVSGGPTETYIAGLAEYQVTVYELRTHRELGSARVVGEDTTCPQEESAGMEVFSQLTNAQLHQVLDPYINRSL
jgi:hypothetical protein